eukprot:217908-Chlamydomonas_euryale.AAC.2
MDAAARQPNTRMQCALVSIRAWARQHPHLQPFKRVRHEWVRDGRHVATPELHVRIEARVKETAARVQDQFSKDTFLGGGKPLPPHTKGHVFDGSRIASHVLKGLPAMSSKGTGLPATSSKGNVWHQGRHSRGLPNKWGRSDGWDGLMDGMDEMVQRERQTGCQPAVLAPSPSAPAFPSPPTCTITCPPVFWLSLVLASFLAAAAKAGPVPRQSGNLL